MPPRIQSSSMYWLLPTRATVIPEVVRTPTPTMLATITKVAVASPNSAGILGGPASVGSDSPSRLDIEISAHPVTNHRSAKRSQGSGRKKTRWQGGEIGAGGDSNR